jgi:RNA polymerase sigma-70 factor (ECF subfamily)
MPHLDAGYTLARYLIDDPMEVDDVMQEAVLRGVRYFRTLEDESSARAWFLAIVRRECYTAWSRGDVRRDSVSLEQVPDLEDLAASPEQSAERSLLRKRIVDAVGKLPGHLREAIVLRELQQLSYEEIAEITESPIGTVMSRISRARARLAVSLRDLVDVDVGEMS